MESERTEGNASGEPSSAGVAPIVSRRRGISPPATAFLIAVNIVAWFVLPIAFKRNYPANPIRFGALWGPLIFSGEWWRLITSSFVHIELFHLLPNMIGLWILGRRLESLLGSLGFVIFYLGCGVVGNLALFTLNPSVGSYGASLSVAGLAGALLVIYGMRFKLLSRRTKYKFGLLLLLVAGLVRREVAETHFFAHTIGLLIGMSFSAIFGCIASKRINNYWKTTASLKEGSHSAGPLYL